MSNDLSKLLPGAAGFHVGTPLLLAFAAVCIALWPGAAAVLQYDAAAVAGGQWWRVITGHWTHWSADHLLWDVATFAVLGLLVSSRDRLRFFLTTFISAAAIIGGLALFEPEMTLYRGLSGIDSALFALLAVLTWRRDSGAWRFVAGGAFLAFAAKTGFEVVTGGTLFADSSDGSFAPVPLAHVIGAAVGALIGFTARRKQAAASTDACPARAPMCSATPA